MNVGILKKEIILKNIDLKVSNKIDSSKKNKLGNIENWSLFRE